jgi:carbamoyl-phosphate synthase large subunit
MRSNESGHVLVSSASGKVPLVRAVMNAARRLDPPAKVIAGDVDDGALARYVADGFWQMPRAEDSQFEALVAGCKTREIRHVFPTRDGELLFWAQHQVRFASVGIDVVVSPEESVGMCVDKLAFARFGGDHGLPFIPLAEHPDQAGDGPYVVKERFGAGGRRIGLQLDRKAALEHARMLEHPVYQTFVAGKEISVDAWLDRAHRVKGLVLRTRDSVVNGESRVTTTFRDESIEDLAMRVLRSLKLRGPVVMQMLIDAENAPHVIECNARFGGASTASIAAGLDVFYWSLLESRGARLEGVPFRRFAREVRQVRVPEDIRIYGDRF